MPNGRLPGDPAPEEQTSDLDQARPDQPVATSIGSGTPNFSLIVREMERFLSIETPVVEGSAQQSNSEFEQTIDSDSTMQPTRIRSPIQLAGYEILSELGRGGMGVVYKAQQPQLHRLVALKMILAGDHAGSDALERFRVEAEAIAQLQHPNIVQIHEIGEFNNLPYFSLEFCSGGSLDKKLKVQPLPAREAAELVEKLALAMSAAHQKGILHRDLKPANVLLSDEGIPKITDFGLAKKIDPDVKLRGAGSELTHTNAIMGTPSYMAPEQALGETKSAGPAADIYALGAILYDCLTGRPPFKGASLLETLDQVRHQEPVPPRQFNERISRNVETICLKCLRKEPGKRYASAAGLADDLHRYLEGRPIQARPIGRVEWMAKWIRRNPVIAGAAVSTTLALVVGLLLALWQANRAIKEAVKANNETEKARRAEDVASKRTEEIAREKSLTEMQWTRAERLVYANNIAKAQRAWDEGRANLAYDSLDACRWDFRGWEHDFLFTNFQQNQATIKGHKEDVRSVCFSPDGKRIASGSDDQTVKVWDAASGQELLSLHGHTQPVTSVSFSPDGKRIASGSDDQTVKVWDAVSRQTVHTLKGHSKQVTSVSFSPDGMRIASGSWDNTVKIWDAVSGEVVHTLKGHTQTVGSVSFSPDGKWIASGSWDNTVKIWDAVNGQVVHTFKGHTLPVASICFSPDGTRIVSGSTDQTVKVWDPTSGRELFTLKGHTQTAHSVAFSPDGKRIASVSGEQMVKVWDAVSGQELAVLKGHTQSVQSVAFSPDGKRIVSGSKDKKGEGLGCRERPGVSIL